MAKQRTKRAEPALHGPRNKLTMDVSTPEIQEAFRRHNAGWIANAMRTDRVDPVACAEAIRALYAAAGLPAPRVVIAPSPLVAAVAGGFAAAIWYLRKQKRAPEGRAATYDATGDATYDATRAATYAATYDATRAATGAATYAATYDATDAATRAATGAATRDATYDATRDATGDATGAATYDATDAATGAATRDATYDATGDARRILRLAAEIGGDANARLLVQCAANWRNMYQGGNMWATYDCYLTAFRDVLGMKLAEHEKYAAWERCAKVAGGFRIMHAEFCIVTDYPEVLKVDDENQAHCDDGPSHRWRDGWSLYHVHGVRVPAYVIERPTEITVAKIDAEQNAEIRRIMIERYVGGIGAYLQAVGARVLDVDQVKITAAGSRTMPRALMRDQRGQHYLVGTDGSTSRCYWMPVPESKTCRQAHESISGLDETKCLAQS